MVLRKKVGAPCFSYFQCCGSFPFSIWHVSSHVSSIMMLVTFVLVLVPGPVLGSLLESGQNGADGATTTHDPNLGQRLVFPRRLSWYDNYNTFFALPSILDMITSTLDRKGDSCSARFSWRSPAFCCSPLVYFNPFSPKLKKYTFPTI